MSAVRAAPARSLRLATRGSPLARVQSVHVAQLLRQVLEAQSGGVGTLAESAVELVVVRTSGDEVPEVPISAIGGQGVFVKEVQSAVLDGRADLAVHSAKDLPADTPPGLVLACVPERADPRDALVGSTLEALPTGAVVATGSVRRRAQLAWLRPDLTFTELRGNMRTRLDRARGEGVDAAVVAFAALARLGLEDEADEVLSTAIMLPQVGQGALAVECRVDDEEMRDLLRSIDLADAHRAVDAERAFLSALGGGCSLPVGALAAPVPHSDTGLRMEALLASADGRVVLRRVAEGEDPQVLGVSLADALLEGAGGRHLEEWR